MALQWLRRLATPLSYLRIRHSAKWKYDFLIPGILTIGSMYLLSKIHYSVPLTGSDGLFASIATLSHVLVGFFIAALAAVATFAKPEMDDEMSPPPPKLRTRFKGNMIDRNLTRRQFLCFLFGYLAFITLLLALTTIIVRLVGPHIGVIISNDFVVWARPIIMMCVIFVFWNMIITTLTGLFYLTDRVHRTEARRIPPGDKDRER